MSNDLIFDTSKDILGSYIIYGRVADNIGVSKQIAIYENGMPLNLTGFTITFEGITHEGKTKVFDTSGVKITDATNGRFNYTFPNLAFSVAGKYERAYFSIVKDSIRYSTANFEIIVFDNADIDAEEAKTIITEYNKLINELYALQKANIAELQNQQDTYIKSTDTSFAAINQKITNLQTQITSYETSVTNSKNTAVSTINAALKEFKAGDFYTKSESDAKFMLQKSAERSLLTLKNAVITVEDWNTLNTTGIYYCSGATGSNKPYTGTLYGYLTVYNTIAVIIQKYEFQNSIYMRTFAGNPAAWGAWRKIAVSSEVVDLTSDQDVEGIKNFTGKLQFDGKEVATVQEYLYEADFYMGTNHNDAHYKTKSRMGWGSETNTIAERLGVKMKPCPLDFNSGRWNATFNRDCRVKLDVLVKVNGQGASSGHYCYIAYWKDVDQTVQWVEAQGIGQNADITNRNIIPMTGIFNAKKGDCISVALELAEGKTVQMQLLNAHFQELP